MRTIIKENITFNLNDKSSVDVLENNKKITEISQELHFILCLFNGFLKDNEIIDIFKDVFNISYQQSKDIFNKIIDKCNYVLEKTQFKTRELAPYIDRKFTINFSKIRAIVPKILVLSVTRDCFMKCRYCYAGAYYSKKARKENSLELYIIEKIIKESKDLGISHIELTGGDPFAREDIFELLDIFKENDITTSLSTKKFLTNDEIKLLKKYNNLRDIQISLDTLNDEIEEKLIGTKNYSSQMIKVIANLVKNNFKVKVNSVVTALNVDDIVDLTECLDSMGIDKHVISPYSNNIWREDVTLFPSYDKYKKLYNNLKDLNLKIDIDYPQILSDINKQQIDQMYKNKCEVTCTAGLDGLVIGPTGSAGICERLIYNEEFSVGNIKEMSLLEIWNSNKLKKFYHPNVENFKESKCYSCEERDYCITTRGICYVHSLILNKNIFSPDYLCKFNDDRKRIF